MGLTEFLRLAIPSIGLAGLIVLIVGGIYGFYLLYQKKQGKDIHCSIKKLILSGMLIGYVIVVILATLTSRSHFSYEQKFSFELFSSYRMAINHFQLREWRNIILNIIMGVPLGILLPCLFEKMRHWWLTYLSGLLFTLLIETTQLITHRGIFEMDDILNNTLGCMIGFGLFILSHTLYQKAKKKPIKLRPVIISQFPLILTILSFVYIFISYSYQELGNLTQAYYKKADMSHIEVISHVPLSHQTSSQPVYKIKTYSDEDYNTLAKTIFQKHQDIIDDKKTEINNHNISFVSKNKDINIFIDKQEATMDITYPGEFQPNTQNLSWQEVKKIIEKEGISIPEQATFTQIDTGTYEFSINTNTSQQYIQGYISVQINQDHSLSSLSYQINSYDIYKSYPIISEKQAFQYIKEGQFNQDWMLSLDNEIIIHSIKLVYREDSKGYYQPVYQFGIENDQLIYIPAIQ
ncbi:VanZ family protein [Massilimicrobiota timonensis]|nr:VanZ family protein [Massilimicrobiota timonensis]